MIIFTTGTPFLFAFLFALSKSSGSNNNKSTVNLGGNGFMSKLLMNTNNQFQQQSISDTNIVGQEQEESLPSTVEQNVLYDDSSSDIVVKIKHNENVILFPTLAIPVFGLNNSEVMRSIDESEEITASSSSKDNTDGVVEGWSIPIHGWIYDPSIDSIRRKAFMNILRTSLRLKNDEDTSNILARRVRPFLVDNQGSRKLTIQVDGTNIRKQLTKSGSGGHFKGDIFIPKDIITNQLHINDNDGDIILTTSVIQPSSLSEQHNNKTRAKAIKDSIKKISSSSRKLFNHKNNKNSHDNETSTSSNSTTTRSLDDNNRTFVGATTLLSPTGLSIISDIDDTIKISNVSDKTTLMRNTFLKEMKPVPGMAELYSSWAAKALANSQQGSATTTTTSISFHLVSSSPWQLYTELTNFISSNNFPPVNSFHLKYVRPKDVATMIRNLFADPFKAKVNSITSIISAYPNRTFILVGDTGERDPEVYGEIYRLHPNQIYKILLRKVVIKSNAGKKKKKKNSEEIDNQDFSSDGSINDTIASEAVLVDADNSTILEGNKNSKISFTKGEQVRFTTAFRDVPEDVWYVFEEASEIEDLELPVTVSHEKKTNI